MKFWLYPKTEKERARTVERFEAAGFTEMHVFKGEYILMVNPETLERVRIYDVPE